METTLLFDFQKLEVYKKAQKFHLECKALLKNAQLERYVIDQLGRASYSVVLNIAEGSGRNSTNAVAISSLFPGLPFLNVLPFLI
jgi:hypothetical protein